MRLRGMWTLWRSEWPRDRPAPNPSMVSYNDGKLGYLTVVKPHLGAEQAGPRSNADLRKNYFVNTGSLGQPQ